MAASKHLVPLWTALGTYRDWRMAQILLIGCISGFPWVLIGSMINLWLQEEGFSRSSIGLFGLVFSVYAVNLFWAPVVDSVRIPVLTRALGRRRAWIVMMQAVIFIAMVALSRLTPAGHLWWIALWSLLIATASATQDVAIDALRIELISSAEPRKVGAGSAMATSGWWIGYGLGGASVLWLVESLQESGIHDAWQVGYLMLLAVVVSLVVLLLLFVPEPREGQEDSNKQSHKESGPGSQLQGLITQVATAYVMPVTSFVTRHTLRIGLILLAIIFFFKIGEAFLGRMSLVFYKEVGFSKSDIALYAKGYGTFTVCLFAVLGSLLNAHYGLLKGLFIGGVAMASTNVLFALLAVYPDKSLFVIAVVADQFTTAISTVAFVAFLSQLCDRTYTATQYAALASLGNLSRTTLAAFSGVLVDSLGGNWTFFFVLTALMVLPSLLLLLAVRGAVAPIFEDTTTRLL